MNATEVLSKVKTLLGVEPSNLDVQAETVQLEELTLENGTVLEADKFEAGNEIFIKTDEDRIPLPAGEYELEDNRILIIKTEGMIEDIKNSEEVVEETQDTNLEHTPDHKEEDKKEMAYATKDELTSLAESVEEVKNQLKEVIEKMMDNKEKKEEMSKQEELSKPAAEGIKHSPEAEDTKLGARFAVNKNQNTTYNRVLNAIIK